MRLRTIVAFVPVAIVLGAIVYVNPFPKVDEEPEPSLWFYRVLEGDIKVIKVSHRDKRVEFLKTDDGIWVLGNPTGLTVDPLRWSGITLLLAGPLARRQLSSNMQSTPDLVQYGLNSSETVVDLGLIGDRHLRFELGYKTTDGGHHYGQLTGSTAVFLIDAAWGDVITRLVTDPPVPGWYVSGGPEFWIPR